MQIKEYRALYSLYIYDGKDKKGLYTKLKTTNVKQCVLKPFHKHKI